MFGSPGEIMAGEAYYDTEEDPIMEEEAEYIDEMGQTIHIKTEPPAHKRKKITVPKKALKRATTRVISQQGLIKESPAKSINYEYTASPATPVSYPSTPQVRSRFAETGRVWERKLDELPLAQALQIEKSINDMLYEAAVANIAQIESTTPVIKVNITQHSPE